MESLLSNDSPSGQRRDRALRLLIFPYVRRFLLILAGVVLFVILILAAVGVAKQIANAHHSSSITQKLVSRFAPIYSGILPRLPAVFTEQPAKISDLVVFGDEYAAGTGSSSAQTAWPDQLLQLLYENDAGKRSSVVHSFAEPRAGASDLDVQYQQFLATGKIPPVKSTLFVVQCGFNDLLYHSPCDTAARVASFVRAITLDDASRRVIIMDYPNRCQDKPCLNTLSDNQTQSDILSTRLGEFSDALLALVDAEYTASAPLNYVLHRHGDYRQFFLALTSASQAKTTIFGEILTELPPNPFADGTTIVTLNDAGQHALAQLLTAFVTNQHFYALY